MTGSGTDLLAPLFEYLDIIHPTIVIHKKLIIAILEYLKLIANKAKVLKKLQNRMNFVNQLRSSAPVPSAENQQQQIDQLVQLYSNLATAIERDIDSKPNSAWRCRHPREEEYERECEARQKNFAYKLQTELDAARLSVNNMQEWQTCWTI